MIFISGVMSIIVQKNTLCANTVRVIYFCPNCVNFLPENLYFFYFFLGWATAQPGPPSSSDYDCLEGTIYLSRNSLQVNQCITTKCYVFPHVNIVWNYPIKKFLKLKSVRSGISNKVRLGRNGRKNECL